MHVTHPRFHRQSSLDYENTKIPEHTLKRSVFRVSKLDIIQKKKKKTTKKTHQSRQNLKPVPLYRSFLLRQDILNSTSMEELEQHAYGVCLISSLTLR